MPDSARCAVPVFRPSDYVVWSLDAEGCVASAFGDGLRLLDLEAGELVGRHVSDLYADRPDLLMTFRRLLAGHPISHTAEVAGVLWRFEAEPMLRGGQVVGASGISTAIHADRPAEGPREREWRIKSLPDGYRGRHCVGDCVVKIDGITGAAMGRHLTDAELAAMFMELGAGLELVRDSRPPILPRRAHLRLLPE